MKHTDQQEHRKMLITPIEACQLLGIGRTTMYKLIHAGVIPSVKISGCRIIYLSVEALNQMIERNTVGGEDNE